MPSPMTTSRSSARKGHYWDGVRNYQARNNMRAMKIGDKGFFYHSNEGKDVVGIVEVIALAHPDPTDDTGTWECVDVRAVAAHAEARDDRRRQGQPEAREHGARQQLAPLGAAGAAGRMGGGLPHGRAARRKPLEVTIRQSRSPIATAFIRANTKLLTPPLVPEVQPASRRRESLPIWQKTEEELGEIGLPPPFWAFAWAGGQALARYVLDHPETVRGKRVIDLASGSGLVAIAAMKAGAASRARRRYRRLRRRGHSRSTPTRNGVDVEATARRPARGGRPTPT